MKKAVKLSALVLALAFTVCALTACGKSAEETSAEVRETAEAYLEAVCFFDYEAALKYVDENSEQYASLMETIETEKNTPAEFIDAVIAVMKYEVGEITLGEDKTTATAKYKLSCPDFSAMPREYSTWSECISKMGVVEVERTLNLKLVDTSWKIVDIT